ncbi:GNAT family N-acetyltransferase [Natronomonas salina]|uniref:GNAT family N-acetyltransferase n=1 Tax=Natronomonas salina TaxID=1710540 RepID=UPI0015B4EEB3|nr:GNAT family N-acetyltransferase [Natronomonas salina]QLD90886.1 GNAT family N-acetyltransferase [Natronomonas salina]
MTDATLRPYDPDDEADRSALWALKTAFETDLADGTGGEEKAARYDAKLTDDYRRRWLAWVDRCVADDRRCVTVAHEGGDAEYGTAGDPDDAVGYVFVLPERLSFVWDAAVVNELYVVPEHRGAGVADALLESAVDLARDQDLPLDRLLLDVDPENERAYAFYERFGFEPWGEIVAREL